ncbi:MAG: PSD1 domain-containing protein [Planctomycetaceae bacterium]|nr:PSD1 domain-containing protein [Planctomycetaceae bacterium]
MLLCVVVSFGTVFCDSADAQQQNVRPVDFNRDIRPILSDRCAACHGPDQSHREADLDVTSVDSLTAERDGHRVVNSEEPSSSLLIERIISQDQDIVMPPADSGKKLKSEEVALLRRWVEEGARWSPHWAYNVPVRDATATATKPAHEWIDALIVRQQKEEGIQPEQIAPSADVVTLIRRTSFDLAGLPPSPEDVVRLKENWSPEIYAAWVDALLASDASAERLTAYWLDLVRFADTCGYHGDQDHNISPYRDWVIDAFSQNMRFDDFTRAQLAGDLLPNSDTDTKIASGYNRMLQTSHEGGVQPREYLAIYGADRVRNVSIVWLGATMGCAQCHDHKYDPYTLKDFYALEAFFADLDEAQHFKVGDNSLPTKRPPELTVLTRRERDVLQQLQTKLAELKQQATREPDNQELAEKIRRLGFEIEDLNASARKTMISVAMAEPRTIRILPRGNWLDDSGEVVEPAVPAFLGSLSGLGRRANRLDLANWLTDPDDGVGLLTARVMVNRFWYLMFGAGLSPSLDDFGGQGIPPAHPALLDSLAVEFVDSGWNVRHLLKEIALTQAYQRSSDPIDGVAAVDPTNQWLTHQSSFRLPAEMVRDNALAVSGLLVRTVGGPSVKPYQPDGYYRHLNFPTRKYSASTDEQQWRRGVYVHWQRQFLHPMLKAFDAPTREECTARRPRSNTPLAALTLMNDPTFVEAARAFADRLLVFDGSGQAADDAERLDEAALLALSRKPDEEERRVLLSLLEMARKDFRSRPDAAAQLVQTGNSAPENESQVELAAWTTVCRALLNLDEATTRY